MYSIVFYRNRRGEQPVLDYMRKLKKQNSKDARIKLQKIQDYINILEAHGTRAPEKYVKHLDGEIYELRPLSERVLFAAWDGSQFILLHCFTKKTQKTPKREIDQAKRELEEAKGGGLNE